jgi:asparagine synthase (glutamine-hydrolysing)
MSVQFGRWNFEGQPPAPDYIEKVSAALAPYGPDSNESYSKGGIGILYRAFHTTKESRREKQPCISRSGAVITWDGRLDNRADLIGELRDSLTISSTDVAIVAAAYEEWGTNSFGKLIGDWALSIFNPSDRSLLLAKDPIGTRHLYYSFDNNQVTWSTILDPLVLFAGKTFSISEEYIAGWFSSVHPAAHLTPYIGILAIPPSSSMLFRPGKHSVTKYWDFDPGKTIRYRTDVEYEEQFRIVFATAVKRRLRSDRPILAELSGGMDSSSIVCVVDTVMARGGVETPQVDTISWYNDENPSLDERPYTTKVEEKRGRTGCNIDLGAERKAGSEEKPNSQIHLMSEFQNDSFAPTPTPNKKVSGLLEQYAAYMRIQGHRVVLSGLGGDEITGSGVPTPTPELQNLLARAQLRTLSHQMKAWSVKIGKPQLSLLWETVRGFLFSLTPLNIPIDTRPAPWFDRDFVRRNHAALHGYPSRLRLLGPLPSFQDNMQKLDAERRLQSYRSIRADPLCEVRYPYLDRDFLEFMLGIPREQIVRVGQRRSLMRRALVGIVPHELLNRKGKALAAETPNQDIAVEWPKLTELGRHMVSSSIGVINPIRFQEALERACRNEKVPIKSLMRSLMIECWLRHLVSQGVLTKPISTKTRRFSHHAERSENRAF